MICTYFMLNKLTVTNWKNSYMNDNLDLWRVGNDNLLLGQLVIDLSPLGSHIISIELG